MKHFLHSNPSSRPQPRGFALVITLSLMVLLTVIAVGLMSLSAISLRSASRGDAMAAARSNARLALTIAIGELQQLVGPDQRITAPANIAGTATGDQLGAGAPPLNNASVNNISKGLTALQPGTRYWTGVWKNSNTATPGTEIYTKTPSPTLLQWLVSGNEISATPKNTPASAAFTVAADGSVSDPETSVLLVGPGTVDGNATTAADNYVTAPLVEISTAAPADSEPQGRYAWWIGDEGVKARINMVRTESDNTASASLIAQRRGWETIPAMASYPPPGTPGESSLPKVITSSQASLLNTGATAARQVFHAATSDSRGVISDVLNGGTRIDLTNLLDSGLPASSPIPSIANYPTQSGNIIPRTIAASMRAPRWSALKDFQDLTRLVNGGSLTATAATPETSNTNNLTNPNVVTGVTKASIAPVVTDFRILMGVRFVPSGEGIKTNPCGKIALAISNPYSVPLKWSQDLEFHVKNQTPPGNRPSRIWNLGNETAFFSNSSDPTEPAVFNNVYFRIRAGTLEPGEVRAYTHSGATFRDRTNSRIVVELGAFGSSSPGSFSNCVEMDTTTVRTTLPSMDVRESWQTTLIGLEMGLSGSSSSSGLLRAIDRFDLDNGYFGANTRNLPIEEAKQISAPIPLMLYSFSLSQPGMDYLNLMPSGYDLGQRGSSLRTFMDFNIRAARMYKPIASYNPPPYFMETTNSIAQLPATGGATGDAFTRDLAIPRWGYSPVSGSGRAILFDVPERLVSLAQLQHADLTGDDISASIGHQPAYAVGNSYATPFVKRQLTSQRRYDYEIVGSPNQSGALNAPRNYFDLSYLLNTSLWDGYFFSSLAGSGASRSSENPTLIFHGDSSPSGLTDATQPAAAMMIEGSFNINSTNKDAWKAFLASSRHFKHKADTSVNSSAAFPRSLSQTSPATDPPSGKDEDSYTGFRRLNDAQIDALAGEIVKQVRRRGPFVSLSHFINRAIGDINTQRELTRAGALQVAVDESGLNINLAGSRSVFSAVTAAKDGLKLSEKNGAPRADMDGGDTGGQLPNAEPGIADWAVTSTDNNFGSVASIIADRVTMTNPSFQNEQGYRSTGIPGWLTQADILQVIGTAISARSDTFRIRTCGEAFDASGNVVARAYCEAIVQRLPDYVDPSNKATDRGTQLNANPVNKIYGRQFQVVSFRWLSQSEI
jgi:Tfp pilus assembly protein PilX